MKRLLLPLLLIVACKAPPTCPEPSPLPSQSSAEIKKTEDWIRELTALMKACPKRKEAPAPEPTKNQDPARSAPRFQIETVRDTCPTCYGFGGTVMATTPSRKAAEDHAMALRSLMAYYNGEEWNRHVTTVPWFGGEFALIFADTYTKPANDLCAWLDKLGWAERYGSGLPGRRACKVYDHWPPEKP